MSDSTKALKVAAARKKLKEFQQKNKNKGKILESEKGSEKCESLISSSHSSVNENVFESEEPIIPKESFTVNDKNDSTTPMIDSNNQNNFFDDYQTSDNKHLQFDFPTFNRMSDVHYLQNISYNDLDTSQNVQLQIDKLPEIFTNSSQTTTNINSGLTEEIQHSSTAEALKQMSSQINNLIDETCTNNNNVELEERNQKLANKLQQMQIENETLKAQIEEKDRRIQILFTENENSKIVLETKLQRELEPLKEQLQTHAQTLGILVAEKTEISTSLAQAQISLKQKLTECEELQGRLRTSRGRVAELEQDLRIFRQEKTKLEHLSMSENTKGKDEEIIHCKQQLEEINRDLLEIKQICNSKEEENKELKNQLNDLTHQLSLAQLKLHQVTVGEQHQNDNQIESLAQEKSLLEKQVKDINELLTAITYERDQASMQYQNYTEQLNEQLNSLASRFEELTKENQKLSNRECELINHAGELEKRLVSMQNQMKDVLINNQDKKSSDCSKKVEEELIALEEENKTLSAKNVQLLEEKKLLEAEIHFHEEKEKDLTDQLEEARENNPLDMSKLMASMESDKIAAARAVAQNTELKAQLEEMQQAFVKSSNDKMELMEKLTTAKHEKRELTEKCEILENQLRKLENALLIKDSELLKERETTENLQKELLQFNQLNDRLRHYEAKDSSIEAFYNEMQQIKQQLEALQAENTKLKECIRSNGEISVPSTNEYSKISTTNGECQTDIIYDTEKKETQTTNVDMSEEIESLKERNKQLELMVYKTNKERIVSESGDNNNDSNFQSSEILNKEEAMKYLEQKFLRTMEEVARLTEEKQRLEHLVTQLQFETETIGEYVALYQHQRAILKQRQHEKDEQLRKLQQDRSDVKSKLDLLNSLIKKLIKEKGATVTSEILRQQHDHNSESKLCSEHAYIRQELNKIKEENQLDNNVEKSENINEDISDSTTQQIISLLSEIKSSSLVQSSDLQENFHPCGWCSGKLITI